LDDRRYVKVGGKVGLVTVRKILSLFFWLGIRNPYGLMVEEIKPPVLVTKHDHLIEAKYGLGLNEQRLILYLISRIHPKDTDFQRYSFSLSELYTLLNLKKKKVSVRKERLVAILNSLQRNILHINSIRDGNRILTMPAWIETPEIDWDAGTVTLLVSSFLKPYLLQLKYHFSSYKLSHVLDFRGEYSVRFLEICKKYEPRSDYHDLKINNRYVKRHFYQLSELKSILGLSPKKYKRPFDFKKWVLEPAQREVNRYTDVFFKFRMVKEGHDVTGVELLIFGRRVPALEIELNELQQSRLVLLSELGCPEDFSRAFLSAYHHKPDQVLQAIMAVEEFVFRLKSKNIKLKFPVRVVQLSFAEVWYSPRFHQLKKREADAAREKEDQAAAVHLGELLKKQEELRTEELRREEEPDATIRKWEERMNKAERRYQKAEPEEKLSLILDLLPERDLKKLKAVKRAELENLLSLLIDKISYKFKDIHWEGVSFLLASQAPFG